MDAVDADADADVGAGAAAGEVGAAVSGLQLLVAVAGGMRRVSPGSLRP